MRMISIGRMYGNHSSISTCILRSARLSATCIQKKKKPQGNNTIDFVCGSNDNFRFGQQFCCVTLRLFFVILVSLSFPRARLVVVSKNASHTGVGF